MHDLHQEAATPSDDLSALAWVQGELRKSLDAAHKALHRRLKEASADGFSDLDGLDPATLRTARLHLHQAVGALDMAVLPAGATLLRASEAVVQKHIQRQLPLSAEAVHDIERASFALLDFIQRRLAGKEVSSLDLFPQYEALMARAGHALPRPTDLWTQEGGLAALEEPLLPPEGVLARQADAGAVDEFERGLLAYLRRQQSPDASALAALCAALARGATERQAHRESATWMLASGFFEGLAGGHMPFGVHAKRVLSSLLSQLRSLVKTPGAPSDRLANELLFFCAQAQGVPDDASSVLARVRRTFGLSQHQAVDLQASPLGRFDPAWLVQASKRVAGAKDGWSAVSEGELLRLGGLSELFSLVQDSVRRLLPDGAVLADALGQAVQQTVQSAHAPEPTLAMEVATSLLYLEAVLEEGDLTQPDQGERVRHLADRITQVSRGQPPQALEAWMEALYRRVSDRQTMGSVVQELRATLSDCEKHIDRYFRDPRDPTPLVDVPSGLQAMRGVLMVLGLDQAAQTTVHMRDDVDELLQPGANLDLAAERGVFDRLATNLGALGFLIDMLGVQPGLAKSLFQFDASTGVLSSLMGREKKTALSVLHDPIEAVAQQVLATFLPTEPAPEPPAPAFPQQAPLVPLAPGAKAPVLSTGLEDDDEMLGVFFQEAAEVITDAREALSHLIQQADEVSQLHAVRRAFHTLKGSARMVGLRDFGEAAWACEQLYNAWLASQKPASPALLNLSRDVLAQLAQWTEALSQGRVEGWHSAPIVAMAQALRTQEAESGHFPAAAAMAGSPLPEPVPVLDPVAESPEQDHVPEPPAASDSEWVLQLQDPMAVTDFVDDMPTQRGELDEREALNVEGMEVVEGVDLLLPDLLPDALLNAEPVHAPAMLSEPVPAEPEAQEEPVKVVGSLRIGIPLFNIYLNEADEQSRHLSTLLNEWALEQQRPPTDEAVALAHSLAGNSGAVGHADLSQLARLLEHALARSQALGAGDPAAVALFNEAADDIRRLLHQFAAGFLKSPPPDLLTRLAQWEQDASQRLADRRPLSEAPEATPEPDPATLPASLVSVSVSAAPSALDARVDWGQDDLDVVDSVDAELFPIFEEEALELLPELAKHTRAWLSAPDDREPASACMRTLHTFKGGARLAGAMRLGELAHRMESAIERILASEHPSMPDLAPLESQVDRLMEVFEQLRQQDAQTQLDPSSLVQFAQPPMPPLAVPHTDAAPAWRAASLESVVEAQPQPAHVASAVPAESDTAGLRPAIDWHSLPQAAQPHTPRTEREAHAGLSQAAVRVRPQLLDRLVNQAGEVSIARTRLQSQVGQIRGSLTDLTDNLDRLRQHLRDIELQADTQLNTRMDAARSANQNFDPLEFDRYTRFQELTRMMAESVNDVATVQRTLQRNLETAEDQLVAQARLTRDLQDDLLRTRMVEFDGLSERLYRVVRQAAKEMGKQVRLDIVGGRIEVDRGVLERMTGAFEHLLRNCITHGIERPEQRVAVGKDETGLVTVTLQQDGNEVRIGFADDGAGLDLGRIRAKAVSLSLISSDAQLSDDELSKWIFAPGFSTADSVTELAGRGIGMDVVRAEVDAMGGRIEIHSEAGRGTRFTLILPLTTAVTKVVMLRCGAVQVAVPTHLIELVRRAPPQEVEQAYQQGQALLGGVALPFYWLGALLDASPVGQEGGRTVPMVIVRSAQQRVALHVDEVLGNQEVVVKNLGPQLSHMPGLAGMTLLASGAVSLIYNPVALATVYGQRAQAATARALSQTGAAHPCWLGPDAQVARPVPCSADLQSPLVMVVDDSLTVRKVTQRLLAREGYRVVLAKDGQDALDKLAQERPVVLLSDIEMPLMDGFDLVRHIRASATLHDMPVIMITSRIAAKHRDHATELGVNHYLGKPYSEDALLALVARYALADVPMAP